MATTSPVVRRRRLGLELRALREATGMSGEEVAGRLSWSTSKLSRMEIGRNPPRPADLGKLLDFYGVTDQGRRDQLTLLLREAKRRGWWQIYSDIPYSTLIGLEAEAVSMLTYEQVVHGLGICLGEHRPRSIASPPYCEYGIKIASGSMPAIAS